MLQRTIACAATLAAMTATTAFGAGIVYNADFTGGLPAGATLHGTAALDGVPTVQNFSGTGTGFQLFQDQNAPGPAITGGGPNGNFLRITHDGIGNNRNHIAFDRTAFGNFGNVVADFDFRATSTIGGGAADGFSMLLIPTASNGNLGAGISALSFTAEEPNIAGVFAVGFDLHTAGVQNDVSIHFGSQIANITVNPADVDLDAATFHHAHVEIAPTVGGSNVTVQLTPNSLGTPGATITPINNVFVAGLNPYESRVEFAGRTGGLNFSGDIDNVNVDFDTAGAISGTGVALTLAAANQQGGLSFAPTIEEMFRFDAGFDFRSREGAGGGADGFSFSFSRAGDVGAFGEEGADTGLAIEFDSFNNGGTEISSNHVGIRFDDVLLTTVDLEPLGIFIEDNAIHHVDVSFKGGLLDLLIDSQSIVSGLEIANFQRFDGQFVFGARTGGSTSDFFIDNFSALVNAPEPSSILVWSLLGMAGAGYFGWRRRRTSN